MYSSNQSQNSHSRQKSFNFFNRHQENILNTSGAQKNSRDNTPVRNNNSGSNNGQQYSTTNQQFQQQQPNSVLGFNQIVIQENNKNNHNTNNNFNGKNQEFNSSLKPKQLDFSSFVQQQQQLQQQNILLNSPNASNLKIKPQKHFQNQLNTQQNSYLNLPKENNDIRPLKKSLVELVEDEQHTKLQQIKKQEEDYLSLQRRSSVKVPSFRKSKWRWVQLFLISLFSLASYYGLQVPSPLQDQYIKEYNIDQTQYNNIFVMFALPNIVLPLFAAPLAKKVGLQTGICIYTIIMMIGAYIQYLSAFDKSYFYLSLGTVIFGIGVNGSVVLLNTFTCIWFIGSELSTSLAVINAIQYLGQVLASLILSPLYNVENDIKLPFFVSFLIICLCLVSYIFMALIDRYAEKYDKENGVVHDEEEEEADFNLQDLTRFGKLFWHVNLCVLIAYGSLCYNNNIDSLLMTNYNLSGNTSGQLIALQFLIQLPLTPLFGYYTDNYGKRSLIMILGSLINVIQFVIFLMVPICPGYSPQSECQSWYYILPLCLGGVGNSLFGAVFAPMVALTVDKSHLEMAFGVLDGMQQLGNSIAPVIMGKLLQDTKKDNGFFYFFVFALICAIIQLLSSQYIQWLDKEKIFDTTYKFIKKVQEVADVHILNKILNNKEIRSQIFQQPRQLVQPISAYTKPQRLALIKRQNIISIIGACFGSIFLYTLYFVKDRYETHIQNIVNEFGICGIWVLIFFLGSFLWLRYIKKEIQKAYDNAAAEVASDTNHISKIFLFFNLLIFTLFAVYAVVYFLEYSEFQEYLDNQLTISIQKLALGLNPYTNDKSYLILLFSILTILCLLYTIYSSYVLACKSSTTDKFMIQLLALVLLIVSFLIINKHFLLHNLEENDQFMNIVKKRHKFIYFNAYATITLITLATLFCFFERENSKNPISRFCNKNSKFIKGFIGYIYVILLIISIIPIYENFTEYKKLYRDFIMNCTQELGNLDAKFIENYHDNDQCKTKYHYSHNTQCPSQIPGDCFKDYNTCSKVDLQAVWEEYLVTDPEENIILSCINDSCCKVLTHIYALPKLEYGIYCLFYLFFSLQLIYFLLIFKVEKSIYDDSDKDSKDQQKQDYPQLSNQRTYTVEHDHDQNVINDELDDVPDEQQDQIKFFTRKAEKLYKLQKILIFVFIIICVFGSVYASIHQYDFLNLPTRSNIQGKVKVQPQENLINYSQQSNQNNIQKHNKFKHHNFVSDSDIDEFSYQNKNNHRQLIQSHKMVSQHNIDSNNFDKFKVNVLDTQGNTPIDQAQLTVYMIQNFNKNDPNSYVCDESQYQYPTYLYITNDNGQAIFPLVFGKNEPLNLIIFVQKNGYHSNCRVISLTQKTLQIYQNFDISIGKNLEKDQSRVLLEWDIQYANDLDLYVNFAQYESPGQFVCEVGVHQNKCGGVEHHGDSIKKLIGKSFEAITFKKIGNFDYLVSINRFVQNLEQKMNSKEKDFDYATDFQNSRPIIKYYTQGQKYPRKYIVNQQNLHDFNAVLKLDLLQFCVLGTKQDLRAHQIPQQYSVWSSSQQHQIYRNVNMTDLPNTNSELISNSKKICQLIDQQ